MLWPRGRRSLFGESMRAALATFAALALLSCGEDPVPTQQPIVVNVVTNVISSPDGIVATPTPNPAAGPIVSVRTGFFGGVCPGGGEVRNDAPMRVGCTGFATATPIGQGGVKL